MPPMHWRTQKGHEQTWGFHCIHDPCQGEQLNSQSYPSGYFVQWNDCAHAFAWLVLPPNKKPAPAGYFVNWRRKRDSNPRSRDSRTTVFKTAAFDRSAIPPGAKIIQFFELPRFGIINPFLFNQTNFMQLLTNYNDCMTRINAYKTIRNFFIQF